MRKGWTERDDLVFTISYALARQKVPARRSKSETRESIQTRRKIIAEAVADHLQLANWKFERGAVSPSHSTEGARKG